MCTIEFIVGLTAFVGAFFLVLTVSAIIVAQSYKQRKPFP